MSQLSLQDIELPLTLLRLTDDLRLAIFERSRGPSADDVPQPAGDPDTIAARAWAAALRSHAIAAQVVIPRLKRRLAIANKLQLGAEIVNATSATTLIGLISGTDSAKGYKIAIASIAVVTSLISAVISFLRRNVQDQNRSDQLASLLRNIGQAEALALRLEIWADGGTGRAPLDQDLLVQAHDLITAFITDLQQEGAPLRTSGRSGAAHVSRAPQPAHP
jgi:hypothetical protein